MTEEVGPLVGIGAVIAAVVGIVWLIVWYEGRYPCLRYQAVWREPWTEMQIRSCGNNCTMLIPVFHPGRWEQQCMLRGDRERGDVRAAFAPIPAERDPR